MFNTIKVTNNDKQQIITKELNEFLEENPHLIMRQLAIKGVLGSLPILGHFLKDIYHAGIVQDKDKHLLQYIGVLNADIADLRNKLSNFEINSQKAKLIETGAEHSTRAIEELRVKQIARIVTNGLTLNDIDAVRQQRVLILLDRLDDEQILLLQAYIYHWPEWYDHMKFIEVMDKHGVKMGEEGREHFDLAILGLEKEGLLEVKQDNNGPIRSRSLTNIGLMLLDELDLVPEQRQIPKPKYIQVDLSDARIVKPRDDGFDL